MQTFSAFICGVGSPKPLSQVWYGIRLTLSCDVLSASDGDLPAFQLLPMRLVGMASTPPPLPFRLILSLTFEASLT